MKCTPALYFVVCCTCAQAASAPPALPPDFLFDRKQALAHVEPACLKVLASHWQEPGVREFQQRLASLDQLISTLIDRLRAAQSVSVDQLLSQLAQAQALPKMSQNTLSPAEIYLEHLEDFAQPLARPALIQADAELLADYYRQAVRFCQQYVTRRAVQIAAADERQREDALCLALIIPLLHVPDNSWEQSDIDALNPWMRSSEALQILERFALCLRRPRTAYQFSLRRSLAAASASTQPQEAYVAYLSEASDRLIAMREHAAAAHYLKIAVCLTEQSEHIDQAAQLRFRHAQLLNTMGHPALAADVLKPLQDWHLPENVFSKAALLRMKYNYDAGLFRQLITEASALQQDPRCRDCRPEMLYLLWLAHRRSNQPSEAATIESVFFRDYPDHPLGADLHFAAAMTALSVSDYKQTVHLLNHIRDRYPNARILPRVEQLLQKLDTAAAVPGTEEDLDYSRPPHK